MFWSPLNRTVLLLVVLIFSGSPAIAQKKDLALALLDAGIQYESKLSGLQFTIRSTRYLDEPFGEISVIKDGELFYLREPQEFVDVVAVRHVASDPVNPWRIRSICYRTGPVSKEFDRLKSFIVLDDEHLYTYQRPEKSLAVKRSQNRLDRYIYERMAGAARLPRGYLELDGPTYAPFLNGLLVSIIGSSFTVDPNRSLARNVLNSGGDSIEFSDGGRVASLPVYSSKYLFEEPESRGEVRCVIAKPPNTFLLELTNTFKTLANYQEDAIHVTDTMEYGDIVLPKRGEYRYLAMNTTQNKSVEEKDKGVAVGVYQFVVEKVEPIPDEVLANWLPPWPEGTRVAINNEFTTIPFETDIAEEFSAEQQAQATRLTTRTRWPWGWILSAIFAASLTFILIRRRRS